MEQSLPRFATTPRPSRVWLFVLISLGAHAVFLAWLEARPLRQLVESKTLELVMVDVEPPPPPPPPPPKVAEPPKPPPPIKVATTAKPPPPPPPDAAPPPPNDAPPPEPSAKPVPLVTGISMSSTVSGGSFSAPVGNTLYGKIANKAARPEDVKPYSAKRYAPIYQVDTEPQLDSEVRVPYPEQAKKEGIEGTVQLSITIDADGSVVQAKVLSGPGYGLDEAALAAIRKFRFRPATQNGEPVATEMKYAYTFLLD